MDVQWEGLLVHSDFVNSIVKNGLLKLLLFSFKMAPLAILVNSWL